MCVVSMVTQSFYDRYPIPQQFPAFEWPSYQDLLEKARKYDEMMNQKDCPEPAKAQWALELDRVMRERYGLTPFADGSQAATGTPRSDPP